MMRNLLQAFSTLALIVAFVACSTDATSSADGNGTINTGGTSPNGGYTWGMDAKTQTLQTIGAPTIHEQSGIVTFTDSAQNSDGTKQLMLSFGIDTANIKTGSHIALSSATAMIQYIEAGVTYTGSYRGISSQDPITFDITTASYDGTTLHLKGSIPDLVVLDSGSLSPKTVNFTFDITATISTGGSEHNTSNDALPKGANKKLGSFEVSLDGTKTTLNAFQMENSAFITNDTHFEKNSDGSLQVSVQALADYDDALQKTPLLHFSFNIPIAAAVTTGTLHTSDGFLSIFQYNPNGNYDPSYANVYNANFLGYDVVLTEADYNGTLMHLKGSITDTFYEDGNQDNEKNITVTFEFDAPDIWHISKF